MNNYISLVMFGIYTVYFLKRVANPTQDIVPKKSSESLPEDELAYWIISNTVLSFLCAHNFIHYARIYEQFSLFVTICSEVLKGLINFMIFLVFWVLLFS